MKKIPLSFKLLRIFQNTMLHGKRGEWILIVQNVDELFFFGGGGELINVHNLTLNER